MKFRLLQLSLLALCGMVPFLTAQDEKKKDPDPKPEIKKPVPEPLPVYGQVLQGKIKKMDGNGFRDFTIEIMVPDQKKIYDLNVWYNQTLAGINRERNFAERQKRLYQFNLDFAKRKTQIYSAQSMDLRAVENIKIRTAQPPIEYDSKGNIVPPTPKRLQELKGNSRLPGYEAEQDIVKTGLPVQVYLAKQSPMNTPKVAPKKKLDGDDDPPGSAPRPEVVIIVVGSP